MVDGLVRDGILTNEGFFLDDGDSMVNIIQADLRRPSNREPVTTLVKGCRPEHAIELCGQIRLSKPARFREYGEGLIVDPSEASPSRTSTVALVDEDPSALQALLDEEAKSVGLPDGSVIVTRYTRTDSHTNTDTYIFGNNGWIFSTSLAPRDEEEQLRWRQSLPPGYNHTTRIYRPREFARSLGLMVVDQLGPRGQDSETTHSFTGRETRTTHHKQQVVVHGPVVYVEDPYEIFNGDPPMNDLIFHMLFLKGLEYRDQREYRFVVWTEEPPEEETVDLEVSMAMLGALREDPADTSA